MTFLLRVRLPDQPGSLGSLAVALGSVGANIQSLDVIERGQGYAVDDLVVTLEHGGLPDAIITAAEHLTGVSVDSIRPYVGLLDTHRELELIDQVSCAGNDGWRLLAEESPRILRVNWAVVLAAVPDTASSAHPQLITVGASSSAPETPISTVNPWPIPQAMILERNADWVPQAVRDFDTELAAAALGKTEKIMILGRSGGPEFRASELARFGYLTGILANVLS